MVTVLKGEKIAGHSLTLSIRDAKEAGAVVFNVTWGKSQSEAIAEYREFVCLDTALTHYEYVKEKLNQKAFTLFEALKYCNDRQYTPYQTADYLLKLGYCA